MASQQQDFGAEKMRKILCGRETPLHAAREASSTRGWGVRDGAGKASR